MSNLGMPEEGGGETCDKTEVERAIREYQRTYNLPETGQLDERTKTLMSTSRCGNKDEEKGSAGQQGINVVLDRVDLNRNPATAIVDDEPNRSIPHKGSLWKRSTSRAAVNSKLLQVLTRDKVWGRGREAHKKHLDDYVEDLRKQAKGKKVLLHKYTSRERRKRSVHVWTNKSVPLGKYVGKNGELFNKDVVRWRLLDSGYSTKIPVVDQRATIDLAFRMWSEVIPLRFKEDVNSDINSVDIEIAFGKGLLMFLSLNFK